MQLFNFVSAKLSLCLIIGILIGFYIEPSLKTCSILLAIFSAALIITYFKSSRGNLSYFTILSYITTISLGIFITSLSNPINFNSHYSKQNLTAPAVWKVKIREILKPNNFSSNYIVEAKSIEDMAVSGRLLLSIEKDTNNAKDLFVDKELLLVSKTSVITPSLNPHQFDYKDYLKKQAIYHRLQIDANAYTETNNPSKTLIGVAANFREQLIKKLKKAPFGYQELGVIEALLLGQRNDITTETYNDYKDAGAVHILAVSGLHIGIILLLLQFLLKPLEFLPKGKTIKLIAVLLLLWTFAFIAGLSPSIFRAVTMFSFVAYAMYLNRPTNTFNILTLSMFFILLVQPMVLFQVGFKMSYAAVFAIVWIYPKLQRFWYPENWIIRKGWQLLSVSCAAQLGVLPISLFYFHQFPSLFFISNLIIIPFLGVILGVGILILILAFLNGLPDFLAIIYNFLINRMNAIIAWVAKQEAFVLRDIPFDAIQLVLTYALIFFFVTSISKPTFKKISLFFTSVLCFQFWLTYNYWQANKKETFILGHQTANTFFLHQKGTSLTILGSKNSYMVRVATDYKIAERIDSSAITGFKNSYIINSKSLYFMDSTEVFPQKNELDYLVFIQSPKINLERLLDSVQPKMILADGSNYQSYVARWRQTCSKKEIPFHYTGEKGAFYFETKN